MNNKAKAIKEYFDVVAKDAKCSLDYFSDYSLIIAILLSAQCTDKKVNFVTKKFFDENKTLEEINQLTIEEIEKYLKPLGLYKNKARYVKDLVSILLEKYDGIVPKEKSQLVSLPGVGNKTANVFLCEFYKIPQFPVDTHIKRISKRLKIANENDSVLVVEKKLKKMFDQKDWIDLHHKFIYFGRNQCSALSPKCEGCKLKEFCSK